MTWTESGMIVFAAPNTILRFLYHSSLKLLVVLKSIVSDQEISSNNIDTSGRLFQDW